MDIIFACGRTSKLSLKVFWIFFALVVTICAAHEGTHSTPESQEKPVPEVEDSELWKSSSPPVKTQIVCCDKPDDVMPYWADSNCRTYFVCQENVPYLHTCPVGMAFSAEHNRCLQWHQVKCSAQNKAVWLAMEATALIRESSSPSYMFARGELGTGPKKMIDTRMLSHKLRDPNLQKMKHLQGLLRTQHASAKKSVDISAYSGPVITIQLPRAVCSSQEKLLDPAQTTSLLNSILQAETGCQGKPADCSLPYLDVRCEWGVANNSSGEKEGHWEEEEEHVVSRMYKNRKGDSGGVDLSESSGENDPAEQSTGESSGHKPRPSHSNHHSHGNTEHNGKEGGKWRDEKDDDQTGLTDNNSQTDSSGDRLKESKRRFSVWATDYSNGYQIEDSSREIHFPEFLADKTPSPDHSADLEADALPGTPDTQLGAAGDARPVGQLASDRTGKPGEVVGGRPVLAESDLFALREHIERKIRESLMERFGQS
ncbi:hypothetical protein EGW08_021857 [Elysia chlorotica]|uniref:Chitin-binding type-2 domain-containing protein n=1 Tax=Elysia chlorotica TaxID=188477 RepID=A0A433SMH0_ELYCH|nr:hypothetical protein EGW08_021857 [Elysia chlorotica]